MIGTAVTVLILCNNLNWEHSPRCTAPVAHFEQTQNGWEGELENGIPFTQTRITPNIMEFRMENVHYYVFKDNIIYAND